MSQDLGKGILRAIDKLAQDATETSVKRTEDGEISIVQGPVTCKVTVNPEKELAAVLQVYGSDGEAKVEYAVDTDLYDIADSDYLEFAQSIERDIVRLIDAIKDRQLLKYETDKKFSLIVPTSDGFTLIKQGRYVGSGNSYEKLSDIKNINNFIPI